MVTNSTNPKSRKWRDLSRFAIALVVLIAVNVIATRFFFRLDLTEDKRYTISSATRNILGDLDDVVYVDVYLEGQFPAEFERLQRSIRETLDEFQVYAGTRLQYRFIDPSGDGDVKIRNEVYKDLMQQGLTPTNLVADEGGKKVERLIFPGAMVSFQDKKMPVMLLKGNQSASSAQRLNQSVEGIEFELASAIKTLSQARSKRIAILRGHSEVSDDELYDLISALRNDYRVERVDLPRVQNLNGFDAIIMAKPEEPFSETDKFKIDQFVINGGKAMFFLNALHISMDSLGQEGAMAFPYNNNLDDMLFKWGVRLNHDLIQDVNSAFIPMFVGYMGDQPRLQPVSWRYYPLLNQFSGHPIVRNMDAIYGRFVGTLDTVKAAGIRKTPLVFTSPYTKVTQGPVNVSYNEARQQPDPAEYNRGPQAVAYLLEGEFQSLYTNRQAPDGSGRNFQERNKPSRILVVSDGDMVRNEINRQRNEAYPLGYDKISKATFANKEFALNALEYLLDDQGVILSRAKEIQLRPLDKLRIQDERTFWQMVNLVLPLVLIGAFGVARYYWRKRTFERF
jgi:ABC-2 type transport system permease protein